MTPKLVIFDCDGVLVDSETVSNQVLVDNLARHGLKITLSECMGLFVGGTMKSVAETARKLGADLPQNWVDQIYSETYARLKQGVDPVKGVVEILDRLDAVGVKYCVASNGSLGKMQITLGQNNMLQRFENAIFSAHELGVSKPDPDLFWIAAGGVARADCVVIEDSLNGVKASIAAGIRCFGYAEHGDGAALSAAGAVVFDNMKNLTNLLEL